MSAQDPYQWVTFILPLLAGIPVALWITLWALVIALPLALVLAVLGDAKNAVLRGVSIVIVEVGRGLPSLLILFILYQGLTQVDIVLDAVLSVILAFGWSTAAYCSEAIRASIAAVSRGQTEAAEAVGMGRWDGFRFIILPQAARIALPALVNQSILTFQGTSLASIIAVPEVMNAAKYIGSQTYQYMTVYFVAAGIYAAITIPLTLLARRLERRFRRHLDIAAKGRKPIRTARGSMRSRLQLT